MNVARVTVIAMIQGLIDGFAVEFEIAGTASMVNASAITYST